MEPISVSFGSFFLLCLGYLLFLRPRGWRKRLEGVVGGRVSRGLIHDTLCLEYKGLPMSLRLSPTDEPDRIYLIIPLSLNPQAEFYAGQDRLHGDMGELFERLPPPLDLDFPWLEEDWHVRGAPRKEAAVLLARIGSLEGFKKLGCNVRRILCVDSRLVLEFRFGWSNDPDTLKLLLEPSAELAFKLMGERA